jgi:hypothetical protein
MLKRSILRLQCLAPSRRHHESPCGTIGAPKAAAKSRPMIVTARIAIE